MTNGFFPYQKLRVYTNWNRLERFLVMYTEEKNLKIVFHKTDCDTGIENWTECHFGENESLLIALN